MGDARGVGGVKRVAKRSSCDEDFEAVRGGDGRAGSGGSGINGVGSIGLASRS